MGSKTRLSSYCTKRANNSVNLVTSCKINTRLARPISQEDFPNKEMARCKVSICEMVLGAQDRVNISCLMNDTLSNKF